MSTRDSEVTQVGILPKHLQFYFLKYYANVQKSNRFVAGKKCFFDLNCYLKLLKLQQDLKNNTITS
jgi:hypothetical protein